MKPKLVSTAEMEAREVAVAVGLTIEPQPHKRSAWHRRLVATWAGKRRPEWSAEQGICKGCAGEIDTSPTVKEVAGQRIELPSTLCEDCMRVARAAYSGEIEQPEDVTDTPKWDRDCPLRHRQVVSGEIRPPEIDWTAYARVSEWRPTDGRGLVMVGAPGTGKSSAFWALARNLEQEQHGPVVLGSLDLGRALVDHARDNREAGWLWRCRVLMVDDLGKERPTPAAAAAFWEVLDKRLSAGLPVIFTTNFEGDAFSARFGEEELGDAIRRRISQLCRRVLFRSPDQIAAAAKAAPPASAKEAA